MNRKKKYFQLWLHVEEVTTDKNGNDLDYIDLDEEFMPVKLGKYPNKKAVAAASDAYEQFEHGIALLTSVLLDFSQDSAYDQQIYEYLKSISRLPPDFKPYWPQ